MDSWIVAAIIGFALTGAFHAGYFLGRRERLRTLRRDRREASGRSALNERHHRALNR